MLPGPPFFNCSDPAERCFVFHETQCSRLVTSACHHSLSLLHLRSTLLQVANHCKRNFRVRPSSSTVEAEQICIYCPDGSDLSPGGTFHLWAVPTKDKSTSRSACHSLVPHHSESHSQEQRKTLAPSPSSTHELINIINVQQTSFSVKFLHFIVPILERLRSWSFFRQGSKHTGNDLRRLCLWHARHEWWKQHVLTPTLVAQCASYTVGRYTVH